MTLESGFARLFPWPKPNASPETLRLEPDAAGLRAVARALDLEGVEQFSAELTVSPWLDGLEIKGRLQARVSRLCGLTLDPFDVFVNEPVNLKAVPVGSPNLPEPPDSDVEIDLEDEDPPEAYGLEGVDLGALLIETLSLSLDPFPRKPGAVFEAPPLSAEESPFQVLANLAKSRAPKG